MSVHLLSNANLDVPCLPCAAPAPQGAALRLVSTKDIA
jgi:hypothetical protein